MEFIAATNNEGKLRELRRILHSMGHTVKSLREIGLEIDPDETGETFAENSRIKARAVCEACGKAVIADDSGIAVDYLNGEPGVNSARYCGEHGKDESNNDKLLRAMENVPKEKRGAKFVSVVTVYLPNGSSLCAQGECCGWIGFERKGNNGFGYDSIFNIEQFGNKSYAELSDEEKDKISHRGRALCALQAELPAFINSKKICAASVGVIGGQSNANK